MTEFARSTKVTQVVFLNLSDIQLLREPYRVSLLGIFKMGTAKHLVDMEEDEEFDFSFEDVNEHSEDHDGVDPEETVSQDFGGLS